MTPAWKSWDLAPVGVLDYAPPAHHAAPVAAALADFEAATREHGPRMVPRHVGIDWDYCSPRGITMREALSRALSRASREPNGCLIATSGPDHYAELTSSGRRVGTHIAVVLARGEQIPNGYVVRHTCDVRGCIESSHLITGTVTQNASDMYERNRRKPGSWARGEDRPSAVLTAAKVAEMRRMARAGYSLDEITTWSGCGYSGTRMAVRGETWQHVTEPPVPGRRNEKPNPFAYHRTRRAEAQRAAEFYAEGFSLAAIGTELGVSRSTAFKLVHAAERITADSAGAA